VHLNFRRAESAGSALSDRLVALIVDNFAFDDHLKFVFQEGGAGRQILIRLTSSPTGGTYHAFRLNCLYSLIVTSLPSRT